MALIDIDWRDLQKKADMLDEIAADLQRTIDGQMARMQAGTRSNWQGTAADLYRQRARTLSQRAQQERNNVKRMASDLRSAARRYRDLEAMAHNIFGN